MPKPLETASIPIPGFYGLNTQDSPVTLEAGFARSAENCIIDDSGRLGARHGWTYAAQTDPVSTVDLKGLYRHLDINGDEYFGCWSDDSFYIADTISGTLTPVTYSGSQTISEGNWQAVSLFDAAYLVQEGYEPIYFNPVAGILDDVTSATNSATVTISNSSTVTVTNTTDITITNSGTVATATHPSHYLVTGDEVVISGATETEYNGTFTVTVLDADTYEYTMSSSPSGDATGSPIANTDIAIVTESSSHEYSTGKEVRISGANETGYNGTFEITVIDAVSYYYKMLSIPSQDATGTVTASIKEAVVYHQSHPFSTGDEVTISGATPSDFNGTFTVTKISNDFYYYSMLSIPTSNPTGTITAAWDKGTPPSANTALSAYGRLWLANTEDNRTTVWWSDLLDGTDWNSGTAGSLDITTLLPHGNDEIVGLGAHNGNLIIFCKNNIIIFADSDDSKSYLDPATLQLVEVISGVGCIARDTIVNTGTDILFLSSSGVRSLGRTIQEKSQPMRDISKNIRDSLIRAVENEAPSKTTIKATYSEHNAFYLLALTEQGVVYCFDTRSELPDGALRVTLWNSLYHTDWHAYDDKIFMTTTQGMTQYRGYQDNGEKYIMQYYTNYFDLGMPNTTKILKKVSTSVIGTNGQRFVIKVATDYTDQYTSNVLSVSTADLAEYNIAEYNIAEYAGNSALEKIHTPVGGSGFVVQLGFETTINGGFLNIQQIDLYAKQGRLN